MGKIMKENEEVNLSYQDSKEKVDQINKLSEEVERAKPRRALELAEDAYRLAQQIGYEKGIAKSLFRMGRSSWLIGDLENAVAYLIKALEIIKRLSLYAYEADVLNVLGNVYIDLENYDQSLEYYMKALKLTRAISYSRLEAGLLNNIGEIYKELKDYETALQYYTESAALYNRLGEESLKSMPILNTGAVHYFLGNYKLAMDYNYLSMEIAKKVNDRIGESYSLHQLGKVYHKIGNREKAMLSFEKSLRIFHDTDDRLHEIDVLIDCHEIMVEKRDYHSALAYLNRGLNLAGEIKAEAMMAKLCSNLASVYEYMKNYEMALKFYKRFHDTEKEANDHKLQQKLRSVTAQFKAEQSQQEKEIYLLKNVELKEKAKELEKKTAEIYESYKNMKIIGEIGQSITSTLDLEKILNRVYENVNNLMDASVFGIGIFDKDEKHVEYKLYIEDSVKVPSFSIPIRSKTSWASWCIRHRKEIMINDVEKQYAQFLEGRRNTVGGKMESVIYCPLLVEDRIIGVVTVQSKKKNAYTQYNLDTIKALASYIAIAIRNAQKSDKLAEEIVVRKEAQSKLEELNQKLMNLSKLDGLTGIPNRRRFDEYFDFEWKRAKREAIPLSLMFIDIDHFKEYNDHYGHMAGDLIICQVANDLQGSLKRSTDFVARYGGDEFVAVLPNTDHDGALQVAKAMKEKVEGLKIDHGYSDASKYITVTIGVSTVLSHHQMSKEELIHTADHALYAAKSKGRNSVECMITHSMNKK
ncbi:MAG: diguanylate cyclase [Bacillota bacterium]